MILKVCVFCLAALALGHLEPLVNAQEVDGSDVRKEVREREERTNKLSTEEQLKLRAAQQRAAEDPEVKAALQKRNKAIEEFRDVVHASMLRSDPTLRPILDKITIGTKAMASPAASSINH